MQRVRPSICSPFHCNDRDSFHTTPCVSPNQLRLLDFAAGWFEVEDGSTSSLSWKILISKMPQVGFDLAKLPIWQNFSFGITFHSQHQKYKPYYNLFLKPHKAEGGVTLASWANLCCYTILEQYLTASEGVRLSVELCPLNLWGNFRNIKNRFTIGFLPSIHLISLHFSNLLFVFIWNSCINLFFFRSISVEYSDSRQNTIFKKKRKLLPQMHILTKLK